MKIEIKTLNFQGVKFNVIRKEEIQRILGVKYISSINTDRYFENEELFLAIRKPDYDSYKYYAFEYWYKSEDDSFKTTICLLDKVTKKKSYCNIGSDIYLTFKDAKDIISRSKKLDKSTKKEYIEYLNNKQKELAIKEINELFNKFKGEY